MNILKKILGVVLCLPITICLLAMLYDLIFNFELIKLIVTLAPCALILITGYGIILLIGDK